MFLLLLLLLLLSSGILLFEIASSRYDFEAIAYNRNILAIGYIGDSISDYSSYTLVHATSNPNRILQTRPALDVASRHSSGFLRMLRALPLCRGVKSTTLSRRQQLKPHNQTNQTKV